MGSISEVQIPKVAASGGTQARKRTSRGSSAHGCLNCNKQALSRVQRKGLLQRLIYPRFGYYPWKCGDCKAVRMIKDRGVRRSRRAEG